jgi:hypothetical protein
MPAIAPASRTRAEAVDGGQAEQGGRGDGAVSELRPQYLAIIAREGDRHGRHAAGLRHQQQDPAIDEGDHGMVGFAQVPVLAARFRQTRSEFGPDECAQ